MAQSIQAGSIISQAELNPPLVHGPGPTVWSIAIDWARNGNFTDTYDDVTSRVIAANWFLGMRQPYQDVADNSALALTLKNDDRRYSPEYGASPLAGQLVPFRPVRIQSSDGLVTHVHWRGWLESIQPAVNSRGERIVQMVATGPMQFLKAAETNLELQEDRRTDEVVLDLIGEVVFPPALASAWVLGRSGNSEIGATAFLAQVSTFSDLDTGKLTLAIAGDNWVKQGGSSDARQDTFNVYHAIRDVAAAERGRFLFTREGKARFWNRHHILMGAAPAAGFDDTMSGMSYAYAGLEHLKNEVIVTCHPRAVSDSDQDVLWELAGAVITVAAGESRTIFVKYNDEDGNRVGAKDVTVGGLAFSKGSATATVEAKATGAELTFTNSGSTTAVITQCIVRGRKITDFGRMDATATEDASIIDYGRRTLRLNLPAIDTLEQAEYIAQYERTRRGQPRGAVGSIQLLSHGTQGSERHPHQRTLTVGDVVTVAETQTGHHARHTVVGESHKLTAGATLLESTWYLEPAPAAYPWQLGVEQRSELGQRTALTF